MDQLRADNRVSLRPRTRSEVTSRVEMVAMTQHEALAMPLEEAMRTQRAIRRLKGDPIDDALLLHILELAMKAPTGSNAQNWEFIVVKDREVVAKLAA